MTRTMTRMTLVVIAALALAGCGGGDAEVPVDAAPAPAPAPTPVADGACDPVADPSCAEGSAGTSDAPTGQEPSKIDSLADLDGASDVFTPLKTIGDNDLEESGGFGTETDDLNDCDPVFNPSACDDATTVDETDIEKTVEVNYTQAVITVNGKRYTVLPGESFPADSMFTLESIGAKTAVIRLTAGEFAGGNDGVTLEKGDTVLLVNDSEGGVEYKITLVKSVAETTTTVGAGSDFGSGF